MAFLVLGGLAFVTIAVFLTFALAGLVIHAVVRLILLPLLLLKWIVMGTVMLVVGPILLIAGLIAVVAVGITLALPLLPLLVLAAIVWMIVKANRPPAVA